MNATGDHSPVLHWERVNLNEFSNQLLFCSIQELVKLSCLLIITSKLYKKLAKIDFSQINCPDSNWNTILAGVECSCL